MKPKTVFLDELNTNSKTYKVQVKLVEKGRPRTSPKKGVIYQSLVMEDTKGNRMKGALFGDQVEGYKDAFVYNGEYEITNAPIKTCDAKWKTSPDDLDFQMSFGKHTVIQPINHGEGKTEPAYLCIANIPRAGDPHEKFDVLGIVLYVEESAREIRMTTQQRDALVREIVITDHSSSLPIVVSAWNDLATTDCNQLMSWPEKFSVVGFTALRVAPHKGFSLTTTMSTNIILSPTGERAEALQAWSTGHENTLSDRQARVLEVRDSSREISFLTIQDLKRKTVHNTLQEERHRLSVVVPNPELSRVHAYIGGSKCGKSGGVPGESDSCKICSKEGCISIPKITFSCEMSDGTGTLQVTTFDEDSEGLFQMSAADLYRIKHTDDEATFAVLQKRLQTSKVVIEVGPKTTLSINNVLQWALKKVVTEETKKEGPTRDNMNSPGQIEGLKTTLVPSPSQQAITLEVVNPDEGHGVQVVLGKSPSTKNTRASMTINQESLATQASEPILSSISKKPEAIVAQETVSISPAKRQKLKTPKIEKNPNA